MKYTKIKHGKTKQRFFSLNWKEKSLSSWPRTYFSPDNHGNIPEERKKAGDQSHLPGNMVAGSLGNYTDDTY